MTLTWNVAALGKQANVAAIGTFAAIVAIAATAALGMFSVSPDVIRRRFAHDGAVPTKWVVTTAVVVAVTSLPSWILVGEARLVGGAETLVSFTAYGLSIGGLLTVIALGALSVFLRSVGRRPLGAGSILSGLGGLGTGACAVGLVFAWTVTTTPVDATTTGRSEQPAPVPDEVRTIGWQWDAPDGSLVRHASPAGHGAVVRTDDGVYALDTATGEERWHYRRQGEETVNLRVSPDGEAALVTFLATDHTGGDTLRVVALDAHTGNVRSDHEYAGVRGAPTMESTMRMTRHSYVDIEFEDERGEDGESTEVGTLTAYDLDTGKQSWTYPPPENCHPTHDALVDEIVLTMQCGEEFGHEENIDSVDTASVIVVLGLSAKNGKEIWRHEERVTSSGVKTYTATDGSLHALEWEWGSRVSSAQNIILGAGGEVLSRDAPSFHGYPYLEYAAFTFTAEGYLRYQSSGEAALAWESFDGNPRKTPIPDSGRQIPETVTPLADMLLSVYEIRKATPVAVWATPWDGDDADSTKIPLDFDRPDSELSNGEFPYNGFGPAIFPAPDAAVAAMYGSPTVYGLQ